MNSDKEQFAYLTEKVVNQESLSTEETRLWIEYLLKLGRGKDSFKSISEQLGSVLGDITDFNIQYGDLKFNVNGLTIPLSSFYTNTYSSPNHAGDDVTSINDVKIYGTKVYLVGQFTRIGGIAATNFASFDLANGTWASYGDPGITAPIEAIETGDGTTFYLGSYNDSDGLVSYNGSTYTHINANPSYPSVSWVMSVRSLYRNTADDRLYIGGVIQVDDSAARLRIVEYDVETEAITQVGSDGSLPDGEVYAIAKDSSTDYFYFASGGGGAFVYTGTGAVTLLGGGIDDGTCYDVVIQNSIPYFCGAFTTAGGVAGTSKIAKLVNGTFQPLGTGLDAAGHAMAVIGKKIYVTGEHTTSRE